MKLSKTKIKINAVEIGNDFLCYNNSLTHFEANKLKTVGDYFLWNNNNSLTHFEAKNLEEVSNEFLVWNKSLIYFNANKLKTVGHYFLRFHPKRKEFCKLL